MNKLYQIKIQLLKITPPIWRRVIIPSDMLLSDFHKVIQSVMGWTNSHLHQFIKDETYFLPRMEDDWTWDDMNNVDYKRRKVSGLLRKENDKIIYEYDFGDSWLHTITLEKITENTRGQKKPVCIAGARNCPPEDCGGPYAYKDFLKVLRNPAHKDHDNFVVWLGEDFDPEYFSVDEVNTLFKRKDYGLWSYW